MISVAVSPCSDPEMTLEQALAAYAALGYDRLEMFTSWAKSAADIHADPRHYLALAAEHGFSFCCIHCPPLTDDLDASLPEAVRACRFGALLACRCAIMKAKTKADFVAGATSLLDGIGDPRMQCLLEVGHFHSVGVSWQQGYEALTGRIRHVHVKDQVGAQSVPFGTGEIDLPSLLERLAADGYDGDVVVEMEVADRENTLTYLGDALRYVKEHLPR